MKTPKETLAAAANLTLGRAEKVLGKKTTRDLVEAADRTLVELGHDAERRQHKRAVKRTVKKAVKAAAVVAAGAAAVVAARKLGRK
jgi:phage tail sheath gpL-like